MKLGISMPSSSQSVLSIYNIENKSYTFIDEISGRIKPKTIKYSKNSSYLSYIYKTTEPKSYLEIFNTETKQKIPLVNYFPDKYIKKFKNERVFFNKKYGFDNVRWSTNKVKLYFDLYKVGENDTLNKKIDSFVFDVEKRELIKLK